MFLNLDQVAAIERCFITVRVEPVELMTIASIKDFHNTNKDELNNVIFDRTGVHIQGGVIETYYEDAVLLDEKSHKLTYSWRALTNQIEITWPDDKKVRLVTTPTYVNPHLPYRVFYYGMNMSSWPLNSQDDMNIPTIDLTCQGWKVETGTWVYGRN